ncbi:MAG: heparinase II/III family protein, partial [Planctomycetales bacterium]
MFQDPISWHTDPKSGYRWPTDFHGDIDPYFCRQGRGDVKYVWELGRQEYLLDCAKAFRLSGETQFAKRTVEVVDSWIGANPYLQGVHWASALEVAVRSLSWLWSYQFLRGYTITAESHLAWIRAFYQHGYYLHRHLSYYSSPNNHLIGEATALYLLGCFFPEFDEADAWCSQGWTVLSEHLDNQYYQDGGSTEQATFYHNYCLGFLLLAVLQKQRRGEVVAANMLDGIERALEFTMWMTRGDGTVPRFGDVDNARSIRFENPPLWDFRNLLCLGAIMFQRADMKAVAGSFSEDALWLLGVGGHDRFDQLAATVPQETSHPFPHSGYYIMRSGWQDEDHHLAFDCGPIAGGLHASRVPSSAHGHSDLMSLTLSAFGKPLLVDGGFYTYDEDPWWYRYFREASAHNTVLVDGASHGKFHPANAWSSVATPGPLHWESTSLFEYVECDHAGFFGVAPPVQHRRSIYWDRQNDWLVLDRLEGSGEHEVEIFFHFAPGEVELCDDHRSLMVRSDRGLFAVLELLETTPLKMQVVQSGDGPDGGWIGTGYGM